MFVCTLYESAFLNRSEPNFAHISPVVWKRPYGMYGPTIFHLSPTFSAYFVWSGCRFLRSRWLPAPHYPVRRCCFISVMRRVLV